MKGTFTYQRETDVLYVRLRDATVVARTVKVTPGVLVDLDDQQRAVGLEILDASMVVAPELIAGASPPPVHELTLAEAAKESGLSSATLRVLVNNGRLPATKRGRDWAVARHELWNYLESRAPSGRPAARRKARDIRKRAAKRTP